MMARLRFGYPTRLLQGSLREKVRQVATFGATGIQLDLRNEVRADDLTETGRRQFRHLLDENGLSVAPPVFPLRRSLIDEDGLEERVTAITSAMRFASSLGARALIFRLGNIPHKESASRPLLVEVLGDLARAGDHVGVTIALTTGREPAESLLEVIQEVTTAPIGANLDPAAAAMAGRDASTIVRLMHDRLQHVRVRDGLREADDAGVEVSVGRGEVDWEALLAALAEVDFAGWMTPDRTSGDDMAADAARAIRHIKNVMPF